MEQSQMFQPTATALPLFTWFIHTKIAPKRLNSAYIQNKEEEIPKNLETPKHFKLQNIVQAFKTKTVS